MRDVTDIKLYTILCRYKTENSDKLNKNTFSVKNREANQKQQLSNYTFDKKFDIWLRPRVNYIE